MKGSIHFRKDRGRYFVVWPHKGKGVKVYRYKGELLYHRKMAEKLLACMQSDWESGTFRIEKYTKEQWTDVIPYLEKWLETISHDVPDGLSPATYKDYTNSVKNHLIPYFKNHPVLLHEIQYDTLKHLMGHIDRGPKGKLNVMYCLRACLDYAYRSNRIARIPPFPKKKEYGLQKKVIKWLPEERQMAVILAIPKEHQPIFWWLKYHFRRPAEAMALHKEDYDPDQDLFIIRRSLSNKKLVDRTKTGAIHEIPCHPDFKPIMEAMTKTLGPYFFVNPRGRLAGGRYQHDYLVDLWNRACRECGEDIPMYDGLKHSSCSQFINELGGTIDELQMITDHARRESVTRYAKAEVEARRSLMRRGKVVRGQFGDKEREKKTQ